MRYEERLDTWRAITSIRPYVLTAMKVKYGDKCNLCGAKHDRYEIDHLRYGQRVTINDLQLLCRPCHEQKTMVNNEMYLTKTAHCTTCTCWA